MFLNRFTLKRAQNACINRLHVTPRSMIFWEGQGAVKIEKHLILDVFEGFAPITLVFLNRFISKMTQNACNMEVALQQKAETNRVL